MAFENGTISFRLFHLPRALPEDAVEGFAAHAALPSTAFVTGSIWAGLPAGICLTAILLKRRLSMPAI